MMVVGPRRSGKGTISRVQREVVGPANCVGPTLTGLGTNFGLWPLLGKTLGIISDARLGGRTDSQIVVERLLSISGEDALTIDRKNLEPVTCKLPTRIMIMSNELPRLGDSSGALAGRMLLLRLRETFYRREDPTLTDKLLAELPGILNWAIEGWIRLRLRGRFVQPASATDLLDELHDISSPINEFIRECCVVGAAYRVAQSACRRVPGSGARPKGDSTRKTRLALAAIYGQRILRWAIRSLASRGERCGFMKVSACRERGGWNTLEHVPIHCTRCGEKQE